MSFATPHDFSTRDGGKPLATRLLRASHSGSPRQVQEMHHNTANLAHIARDFAALQEWTRFRIPVVNFLEEDVMDGLDRVVSLPP